MTTKTFYCSNCGKPHQAPANIGTISITCLQCQSNFTANTGENDNCAVIIACKHCDAKIYAPKDCGKVKLLCPACGETFLYDSDAEAAAPAPTMETTTRFCQFCGRKMLIPANVGHIRITCPYPDCGKQFEFGSAPVSAMPVNTAGGQAAEPPKPVERPKPVEPPKPVERPKPVEPPKPVERPKPVEPPKPVEAPKPVDPYNGVMRSLHFIYWSERIGHTLDPLTNFLSKGSNLNIYDDGELIGSMKSEGSTVIEVSPAEHHLSIGFSLSGGLLIPKGTADYILLINKEGMSYSLAARPAYDPFFEELEEFVLGMCQKSGLSDRILMRNNRNKSLHLGFHTDHISIEWDLEQTHGLKQWATGRDGETIYYNQVLRHRPPADEPGNYWIAVRMLIASSINEKTDMFHCSPNGVLKLNETSRLY